MIYNFMKKDVLEVGPIKHNEVSRDILKRGRYR